MELIDLSIIAHASKSSACFTKGCVNMKKKKNSSVHLGSCRARQICSFQLVS